MKWKKKFNVGIFLFFVKITKIRPWEKNKFTNSQGTPDFLIFRPYPPKKIQDLGHFWGKSEMISRSIRSSCPWGMGKVVTENVSFFKIRRTESDPIPTYGCMLAALSRVQHSNPFLSLEDDVRGLGIWFTTIKPLWLFAWSTFSVVIIFTVAAIRE